MMRQLSTLSLKVWLSLLVFITFSLLWAAIMFNEYRVANASLIESGLTSLKQDMAALQNEIALHMNRTHPDAAARAISIRGLNTHYQLLAAIDREGKIWASTRLGLIGRLASESLDQFDSGRFRQLQLSHRSDINLNQHSTRILAYIPLRIARDVSQIRGFETGALFLIYDLSRDQRNIWDKLWQANFPIFIGLLLSMLVIIGILHRFVARPIERIVNAIEAMAQGNVDIQSETSGMHEIAQLGHAFNDMAAQIKLRFEQQQLAEQALLDSEFQKKALLNNAPANIYMKDLEGRYLFINSSFEQQIGRSSEDITGLTDFDLFPDSNASEIHQNDLKALQSKTPIELEETGTIDGNLHTFLSTKFAMHDTSGDLYAIGGISTDISARKQAEQQILQQAHFDSLTGLPNRFLALDRLEQMLKQACREQTKVAVLFLDMDDFKRVNDTLGHEVGDRLLAKVAERLGEVVRTRDTVGRLGGDEFIILLDRLEIPLHAQRVAELVLDRFKEIFRLNGRDLILTASVGVAVYPDDGDNSSALLRNADSAMYHAKSKGRNTFAFFDDSMNREASRRLAIEEQLHGAIDQNNIQPVNAKQISVVYQPLIDVANLRIVGAEALLRWHNPVLGDITPDEFIPVSEQTGLIVPLGQYVITEAMKIASRWQQRYQSEFKMGVNLSPRQFRDPDLIAYVKSAIESSEAWENTLELEITEGLFLNNDEQVASALKNLSSMGVTISMDDFGTGYSSLSYLRTYPFNILKIDRSFVRDICEDNADRELITAAIAMAHGLGLKVVAEGVETLDQFKLLQQLGCDIAQGFLFSRPLKPELFLDFALDPAQYD